MINLLLMLILIVFQTQTEPIISKIQQKFESIKTLQADFVQTSNNVNLMKGKFYFSQKENYRIELKNNTLISDGSTIWNIDKKRNKVIISNVEDDPLAFSLNEYIYEYPEKCKITTLKMDDYSLIILDSDGANLNFKLAKLWINKDYLITKILIEDFSGGEYEFSFTDIKLNSNLDSEIFIYRENKDYKTIDLR